MNNAISFGGTTINKGDEKMITTQEYSRRKNPVHRTAMEILDDQENHVARLLELGSQENYKEFRRQLDNTLTWSCEKLQEDAKKWNATSGDERDRGIWELEQQVDRIIGKVEERFQKRWSCPLERDYLADLCKDLRECILLEMGVVVIDGVNRLSIAS